MSESNVKWNFNVRRRFSWFVEYFQIMGTNKNVFQKVLGIDFSYSNMKKDADYNEFTDAKEEARSLEIVKEKTRENFDFLHELAEKSYRKSEEMLSCAKRIKRTNYKDLSNAELKLLFDEISLQLMEYQPVIFLIFPVEKYLEDLLKENVTEAATAKRKQSKLTEYLPILSMPKEELVAVREEKSLLEIAIAKQEGKEINTQLETHLQNFAWIPTDDPTGKPWTKQDILTRVESLEDERPKQKLEKMIEGEKEREQKFKEFVKELGLDGKTVELVKLVREFVYLRNYRVECWVQTQYLVRHLLEFVASKAGLSFNELVALSSKEISEFLETGKLIGKEELEKRLQAYTYIKIDEKYKAYFGEEAQKLGHFKEEEKAPIGEEVKGSIANKGKATGIVKVVKELSDLPKVEKGDILVASMTVPQYIPAMEKAAAFVTDEGGITCHAAIVSRELDVPCIVGTRNATKILKDGDRVEVDAEKGIVRKLS